MYVPAAMVLSVVVAHGKVPLDSSWNSALPLLTLECLRTELLEVLKDMILLVLCAYRVSAPSRLPSGIGTGELSDFIGAVKERRMEGGAITLSGVEGADASAMLYQSMRWISRIVDA